jgi:metallo-beta-lactamase family protein
MPNQTTQGPTISFFGAAGEVTGSCYIVTQGNTRVMVDMGMHQGEKEADEHNRRLPDGDLSALDAVVLTHAHLDHCGRLPLLIKAGYKGPIFCTPATAEVTGIILRDAAFLQKEDCDRYNRKLRPNQAPCEEPLYDDADVDLTLRLLRPLPYTAPKTIAPGFEIEFADAGHILGAASVRMTIASPDRPRTILFSGDVGVTGSPILRDPSVPPHNGIDAVILESTYGDRDHRPLDQTKSEFLDILKDAQAKKARVLIPAFAVGRTQDIVFHLGEFFRNGLLKRMPVIVDSPMASSVSTLYTKHKDVYDERAKELLADGMKPLNFEGLSYTRSPDESKSLNDREGPLVIISASGMATGGRILHHLKRGLPDPNTHIVIVGFQGHGTLGRRLVDRAESVRIFGMEIDVNAKVHTLGGFSAHAGQTGLLNWAKPLASATHKPHFYLTHGEDHPRSVLASLLRERFNVKVDLPYYADTVALR